MPVHRASSWVGRSRGRLTTMTSLAVVAILAIVGVIVFLMLGALRAQVNAPRADLNSDLLAVERLRAASLETQAGVRGYLVGEDRRFLTPWLEARASLASASAALLRATAHQPAELASARTIVARSDSLVREWQIPLVALAQRNLPEARARFALGEAFRRTAEIERLITRFAASLTRVYTARERAARTARRDDLVSAFLMMLVLLGAVALFGGFVVMRIARPLTRLSRAVSSLGRGDSGVRVSVQGRGELARLGGAFNEMARSLETGRAELEREHAALNAIFSNSPVGIAIFDRELRFRDVNEALVRIGGGTAAERIGRTPTEFHSGYLPIEEELRQVLDEGTAVGAELLLTMRDGADRTILANAYPIPDGRGMTSGIALMSLDVSERKQVETARAQLEAALAQAEKTDAISQLAGGIAHDFNNLLAVILGYAALLKRASLDERASSSVDQIEVAGKKAAALVSQMLAFGRRQMLQPRRLDLNELIDANEPMLRSLLGGISLQLDLERPARPVVADESGLERVLVNLIANARDALGGGGGEVRIRTRNVEPDPMFAESRALPGGAHVLLEIEDTGKGMDSRTLARAFEPFYTTKEVGKGTGLGLSSVYGIVEQSGGSIELGSRPGHGTTVSIYLPAAVSARPTKPAPERTDRPTEREAATILLVEDNEALRSMATSALEEGGYRVLAAGSGREALTLASTGARIDLLLTDVIMPAMNGPRLAERICTQRPLLPVLFMSAFSDETLAERAGLIAGNALLKKPFALEELLTRVAQTLRRARPHEAEPRRPLA